MINLTIYATDEIDSYPLNDWRKYLHLQKHFTVDLHNAPKNSSNIVSHLPDRAMMWNLVGVVTVFRKQKFT